MKIIKLTNSKLVTTVSDSDYELLIPHKWFWSKRYIKTYINKKQKFMHKMLLNSEDLVVDHIDGNTLNNTRENLRICTQSQNSVNAIRVFHSSIYKGVSFNKKNKKNPWKVQYQINNVPNHLGYFPTEESAALAYNDVVLKAWGEFAVINDVVNKCQVRFSHVKKGVDEN